MATISKRQGKYRVQIRRQGYNLSKTFSTKASANTWARHKEVELELQALPNIQSRTKLHQVTFRQLLTRYRDEISITKNGYKQEASVLNAIARHPISYLTLAQLHPQHFVSYKDERLRTIKPNTLAHELDIIRNLFNVARNIWLLPLHTSPLAAVKYRGAAIERDRRLHDGELVSLLSQSKRHVLTSIILFAIETGMREGELLRLCWDDVDLTKRILIIHKSKNGYSRTIPLSNKAIDVLVSIDRGCNKVFLITGRTLRRQFNNLTKLCGIKDLRFHDLRHEAISLMFEKGLSVPEVASISGHRDWRKLRIYANPKVKEILRKLNA